jgi:predicted acylesterase/phospholipase RssA
MPIKNLLYFNSAIIRIAFAGCGVNGIGYSGANQALDEAGILEDVEHLAGSSSGSITSAMIAVGLNPNLVRKKMIAADLGPLLGERSYHLFKKNQQGTLPLSKNGKPLEDFIRNSLVESIKPFMKEIDIKKYPDLQLFAHRLKNEASPCISFADLALLNRHFPKKFKKLTVNAVTYPKGELRVFNSELTPNVDIAKACHASSSVPIVLEPTEINGELLVDGSMYENTPTEFFDVNNSSLQDNKKPTQTLLFCFGLGGNTELNPVYKALYGTEKISTVIYKPSFIDHLKGNFLPYLLVGFKPDYQYTQRDEDAYQKIRHKYPLRTVELRTGNVSTHLLRSDLLLYCYKNITDYIQQQRCLVESTLDEMDLNREAENKEHSPQP